MLSKYLPLIFKDYLPTKNNDEIDRKIIDDYFKQIQLYLQNSTICISYHNINVEYSIGKGSMALIPWISFLNENITNTTQEGVYCVYLFREDMSGVYLTFNQGVGAKVGKPIKKENIIKVENYRNYLRNKPYLQFPEKFGIKTTNDIDLKKKGSRGKAYEKATIAYKYYDANNLPSENTFLEDLDHFLELYQTYFNDNFYQIYNSHQIKKYIRKETLKTAEDLSFELQRNVKSSLKASIYLRNSRIVNADPVPKQAKVTTTVFLRNPDIIAEVLIRANGICENCRKPAPFIRKSDGSLYLEIHHQSPLSKGGLDNLQNAIAVCPNCHRRLHYG